MTIRELDPRTVERIAAGEVVERPASVVKELVENSLDADASRVRVEVERGGNGRIRVRDDGRGMTEEEVRKAVRKHTTSKIEDVDDLEAGVGTLGFRGEALYAIGAVSRMTITTRPRGGERGTELRVEGGDVVSVEPAGCPEGTTVAVEDLFFNVPARRKYLKRDATEFAHVNTVAAGYALANPAVAVTLEHGGRETFATTGQGDLRAAVLAVYGREVAESMVRVDAREDGDGDGDGGGSGTLPDGPLERVRGLVSHPETTRSGREYLSTFVNGRYVTAGAVRDAVVEAYGKQLAPDRYPFAVLFLDLPGGDVDVNVHPRKLEIRFADEEGACEQVRAAVERALLDAGLIRSSAPRGRSAPEQTEIRPERASGGKTPAERQEPTEDGEAAAAPREQGDDPTADEAATRGRVAGPDADDRAGNGPRSRPRSRAGQRDAGRGGPDPASRDEPAAAATASASRVDDPHARRRERAGDRKFTATEQRTLAGDETEAAPAFDRLPSMRVLGQLHGTYVVAETPDGLVLVDQHAADERVNYERLRERFEGETASQALAEPVELDLTAREAALFEEYEEALARLGFHASRADDRRVEVRTLPAVVADAAGPELVRDALSSFVAGDPGGTVDAAADALLADLACYPSITGNTSLTEGSVLDLLCALDACENPYACPHGRPVIIELSAEELDERFERDYPGHAGRREG